MTPVGSTWRSPDRLQRPPLREQGLEAMALAGTGVALAAATLLLVLLPQRLAQRPAARGVIVLHLDPLGRLRLWNQPVDRAALQAVLQKAGRDPGRPRLRLQPQPGVPWGQVQAVAAELETLPLPLELQLP